MAFGMMGMNPSEFWRMSLKEFRLTQKGFFEKENMIMQRTWEQTRFISFNSLVPHAKKGRLKSPKDLITFDWEKEKRKDVTLPTQEEMRYWQLKYGKKTDENGNGYNA